MVLIKSSFASVLVGAALTASASGAALPPTRNKHDSAPGLLDVNLHARSMQEVMMAPGPSSKADAGRLAPAEKDIKHIAESLHPHPKFPKRVSKGDNVDFTQQPDRRWTGKLGRRGPRRQDKPTSLINLDLDGVKGDSPRHGTLLDLDARGQSTKGKSQDNKMKEKSYDSIGSGEKKHKDLVNADIDGRKGDSKGEGQVADVDARAFPPKPKGKSVPSSPEKPKDLPQPPPQAQPKGGSQGKMDNPAQKIGQGAEKEKDLISADVDGVKGDSRAKGQLVDVDARAFPPKPKAKPATPDQPKQLPKDQPKPLDQPPKPPTDQAPKMPVGEKEQDLVSADIDGVKGNSKAHGQLVDLDARGRPASQTEKQGNLINIDLDGQKDNSRSHGSLLNLDARGQPMEEDLINIDLDGIKGNSRNHGTLLDLDARSSDRALASPKPEARVAVHDKRYFGHDRIIVMDEEDRYTRPFPYRVFGGRPHRFVSQSELPTNGDVHLHEHLHQHFAKRRHGDGVVVVDTDRHGHRHGHSHGHHRGDVVVVDKRRHSGDVVVVDGDRHGHHHGHVHTHGHHGVVVVDKRDGQHVDAEEGDASGFKNGEGRPGVESIGNEMEEQPEDADAEAGDGSVQGDAGSEHAEGALSKRRHSHHGHHHGHNHGHTHVHSHGGVTVVNRDLEARRHRHTKVVVVDGHRYHRHRPLIEIDKRQENAASIFNRIKGFLTARRHHETTVVSTDRHGHGTTVVETGRHGDTVVVDGHRHHRRDTAKVDVDGHDREYADTVVDHDDQMTHHHGTPIYVDSSDSRIVSRAEAEVEDEHLAPLYKRRHGHHGHHRCRHGLCDADDVVVVHSKRDVVMGGAPGYIDVTSPVFNSTTAQRIASLVLSTSNGTDAASDFVLNASNNIRTQVYLVPINETSSAGTSAGTNESGSPVAVNLKVPIFVPSSASVQPYCATFDPAPTAPAPMSVMPCTSENNAHQSQTFLYYADTGVIHPDWKPAPASESLMNAMADTVDEDDSTDADPKMSIDEVLPSSATGMPSETGTASVRATSSASVTASSAGAMATESAASPSSTSSIPELPSMTSSASASGSAMGAASAAASTMPASGLPSAPVMAPTAPSAAPSGGSASPSNVTLVFTPANPSAQSGMGSTTPAASSFDSTEPTQENFGAQDASGQSATPSASASSSAASSGPTPSASTSPSGDAQGYPVTPTQSSYDPANPPASSSAASTESYNGPDNSDEDDTTDPEPQGDDAFTSTATGQDQDWTAPYQRR